MSAAGENAERLVHLSLDDPALTARNADLEHERRVAIFDILENNHFALVDGPAGPYRLKLSMADRGIVFAVSDKAGEALNRIELSMRPLRRNIRDYFLICESYFEAMRTATPERVETIDQARRALHNESAELLKTSLADEVRLDDDTARRLFTLISVLQMRG
ncbi:MAG TPA: hypothetical protein DCS39_02920 [Rhodobiaceae bacterium]|nr:hypothetical protein [Rhodobiaceae bacterium]|tara:strand:+ start:1558 stop:2043 length:486 start_codon:yes stop_codon:yes gene_type:complete